MHRKPLLVNKQERLTDEILEKTVSKYEARVFSKIRIADVLDINNSGISNKEYTYALKAHFDFVVTNEGTFPEFVVEFDEKYHKYNKSAILRDELKNSICCKLKLPLLRVTSEYFEKIGDFSSILNWITELYFTHKTFLDAQDHGEIPLDEPWTWFSVVGYDPFIFSRIFIQKAYDDGLCCEPIIRVRIGNRDERRYHATLATLKIQENKYLTSLVECSAINFYAVPAWELSKEIAECNIAKKLMCLDENKSEYQTYEEVSKLIKEFDEKYIVIIS
ncbi:hypothetical protein MSMTP_2151 [Methanosarcina sp. MTP4]|uniref:DUF2726 domain-containing protein n=1 Tax=Methanosarcina sp. MTP4 TaxID=1434100 RepID=UPI000615DB51|nr:DUF2726 domain-containing protein [Methanosarcina sp. MTP4]AKB25620.1 hypothetical protein MSMTP_2151 [Methanosarcina sp. MTP4]